MIKINDKLLKRLYVEETLKNRKYMGFRLDIALIKSIVTATVLILLYMYTKNLLFSIIIGLQLFLILTLINKMTIDKKIKLGKKKLSQRIKREKFKEKIFYSDYEEFENFIMFYLNQYRYKDIKKINDYHYSAIKNGETVYINLIKFYEDTYIEKTDIRDFLTTLINNKIKKSIVITLNELSQDAKDMLDKFKYKISFEIIKLEDLYCFADTNFLLSEAYEYEDIEKLDKKIRKKPSDIISNVFINKKIIIYLLAAALFYAMHLTVLQNQLGIYITYYFIILAVVHTLYNLYRMYEKKNMDNK